MEISINNRTVLGLGGENYVSASFYREVGTYLRSNRYTQKIGVTYTTVAEKRAFIINRNIYIIYVPTYWCYISIFLIKPH